MKFTLSWLKEFLATDCMLTEITAALTSIGLEVEAVADRSMALNNFSVGYITQVTQHPLAAALQICQVETGSNLLQVVCGAANAGSGIKVVLAEIGAVIPRSQLVIKASTIRGVESYGMLCSSAELLLGDEASSIMVLGQQAVTGSSAAEYLGLDDPVIDINVTPNRSDALSVYGIARDLAAKGIGVLKELVPPGIPGQFDSDFALKIDHQVACQAFLGREIINLVNQPSPDWLKNRLRNIGIDSISAVTDIANYILYSFGWPLDVCDADQLSGGLTVCVLAEPEQFLAANNQKYNLLADDLVIKDHAGKISAIAGIITGNDAVCRLATTRVILTAGCFAAINVAKTGRRLQIDTAAKCRFERGVDCAFVSQALDFAVAMIMDICGGRTSKMIGQNAKTSSSIKLQIPSNFLAISTGIELDVVKTCQILTKLGFKVSRIDQQLEVTAPSWRHDIAIKEDIAEEVVRIYGYEQIPETPLSPLSITRIMPPEQKTKADLKRISAHQGYQEVVTWSFMDSNYAKFFANLIDELRLLNPISAELDYMRPSIIPNLLKLAAKNFARSINDLSIFELGPVFNDASFQGEVNMLSGIRSGYVTPKNSHQQSRLVDVFDIKADLAVILDYWGLSFDKCQISLTNLPGYYHPTRSAAVMLGTKLIAKFGQINPAILKYLGIHSEVSAFELSLANMPSQRLKCGKKTDFQPCDFQVTLRDYAFVIDHAQPVGPVITYIKNLNKQLIKTVHLFDLYSGDKLALGKKSITVSVEMQAADRTLTANDLSTLSQLIISKVEQKFGACLREF